MFLFKSKGTTAKNNKEKSDGVIVDAAAIDAFLTRGVEHIFPNVEFVRAKMLRGEKLSMYLGVDPTGPTLHLGHAIPLRKLGEFQKLGHQVIFLIGDMTAMIGDPTDKTAARKKLTRKEVLDNARLYRQQAERFISFTGANKAIMRYNSEWLDKMNFGDVLELASNMTVDQMLKRDMFDVRMREGKPIYIHEFMYPLMQGYDSVAMDVDGEIGGNDQTFNMLAGRDLMKSMKGKEKFVIGMKLLTDPTGKKMGKTEGNIISLDQNAEDMFGRVMSWPDELIIPGFEICTEVGAEEIAQVKANLETGGNPRDAKVKLAKAIVTLFHDAKSADTAEASFVNTFKKGELPEDVKDVSVSAGTKLVDILLSEKIIESKSEFRRLIEGKGVSEVGNGDPKIEDTEFKIERDISLRIGKKRFIKIKIK